MPSTQTVMLPTGAPATVAMTPAERPKSLKGLRIGLLDNGKNEFYGRPAYLYQMPDGAMLVSDEQNGAVYRITYGR